MLSSENGLQEELHGHFFSKKNTSGSVSTLTINCEGINTNN